MADDAFRLRYDECRDLLLQRLAEPAPGRIQLIAGPRQVGKTTLLLELAQRLGPQAVYAAADGPEAAVPGFWDRLWQTAERTAAAEGHAVLLLDEAHVMAGWAARLKGEWDRLRRRAIRVHVVATGSSALRRAAGSRESLGGRFERLTLTHWSAAALADAFGLTPEAAATAVVQQGAYPGAFPLTADRRRWLAYVRDAIVEPAIGRDILALAAVRRPALLRQVFGVCIGSPAQVVALQKIQGQLQDRGALETIAHYLALLEEAFLVAPLTKHAANETRRRSAPPKLVVLSNALLAAADPNGAPTPAVDPARFGRWVENACLAFAWNAGQHVSYWREEPLETDAVLDGSWGRWAVEVKMGPFDAPGLRGLFEFVRRRPEYRPLVICDDAGCAVADRLGVPACHWQRFLLEGPPC